MAADQFVLVPRPPVRAFAVAAVLALVGVGLLLVPAGGAARVVLVVLTILLIGLAAGLMALAVGVSRRQRVTVQLDEAGYRVDSPAGVRVGAWAEVTKVTAAPGRITLHQGEAERVHMVAQAGQVPQLDEIARAISQRLDADRGYQVWQA